MATELVTVRELAEALGVGAHAEAAVHESLIADGVKILEDWAGRIAVSAADAKRIVDKHRQQETEWQERNQRELQLEHEARQAQSAFDEACGRILPELRRENIGASPDEFRLLDAAARRLAWDQIKDQHSPEALAKVVAKPIMTIEPAQFDAFRPIPIPPPVHFSEGSRPQTGLSSRVKSALGLNNRSENQ